MAVVTNAHDRLSKPVALHEGRIEVGGDAQRRDEAFRAVDGPRCIPRQGRKLADESAAGEHECPVR